MSAFSRLGANARGIVLMILAIFLFSSMDAIAKSLMQRFEPLQVVWARYTMHTVFAVLILAPRLRATLKTKHLGLQLLRSAFLFGATMSFFMAISLMPLGAATAVMNIHPVLLTLGAALLLGEALGPRRLFGIAAALTGALIIIRPGSEVFSPAALFPLAGGVFYASYALSTRFLGRDESIWTSFLYTAIIGTLVASAMVPSVWTPPSRGDWGLMLLIGAIAAVGQLALIRALTEAEAGVVAPFGYAGVVFSTLYGLVAFSEVPDLWTVLGALVIVGAGVYVWHRETTAKSRGTPPVTETR